MSSSTVTAVPTSVGGFLNATQGQAQEAGGQTIDTFFASLIGSIAIFGIQLGIFLIIKNRFTRIYQPRTYLVPERERTTAPPSGIWRWITPVFQTSNSDFIQKCGLDAYFFLRYLRTLLKIFIPCACIILPILLPLNAKNGRGPSFATGIYHDSKTWNNVTGLDQLAWGNVPPNKTNRYWAHLILAVGVIVYTCWVFFDELRGYIRLRQAYLTSPQHRLRASATTVLVTAIPRKWCTVEALDGLYDVFPGGIRNIWVNRNFDELNDKVKKRNTLALALEAGETALIKKAKKAHMKLDEKAKKSGSKKTKQQNLNEKKVLEQGGDAIAETEGISAGNPHQVRHTLEEALYDASGGRSKEQSRERERKKPLVSIPILGQGFEVVGQGIEALGKSVLGGFKHISKDVDGRLNSSGGFVSSGDGQTKTMDNHISDGVTSGNQISHTELSTASYAGHYSMDGSTGGDPLDHGSQAAFDKETRQSTPQDDNASTSSTPHQNHQGVPSKIHDAAISPREPSTKSRTAGSDTHMEEIPSNSRGNDYKHNLIFWKEARKGPFDIPSPTPHGREEDEFPLNSPSPTTPSSNPQASVNRNAVPNASDEDITSKNTKLHLPPRTPKAGKEKKRKSEDDYPEAYNKDINECDDGEPAWKLYVKEKDRETMRLPIFGWDWMISLPLVGKKVDTIYYCRQEVARLNVEIEQDQREPDKFPLMNSAFIQFNHQVAAHMACQSVSHHIPSQMAPRLIEISPDDVIWSNMSIKWWERYIRSGIVILLIAGLIFGWAFPVTFTGLLSQVDYLARTFSWLAWLSKAPKWVIAIIQGILPQALLAALLALLPIILRLLAKNEGVHTGMAVELKVQQYYFFFLFFQVFLVVSISSALSTIAKQIADGPQSVPTILAQNLPKAANYFFSYLLLQALSTSAGALVQVMSLIGWFLLAPIFDNTARQKWKRQIKLPQMQWGTFFPVYTNLAAIGLIYSVVAPLILVFNIITFGLFWIVYRYNTLYVTQFRFDTGGLLYPKAINQLFTGLYVMELCLIGLFFLVRKADDEGNAVGTPCKGQAIVMIVVLCFTVLYQVLLNNAFAPLFRYLPITLEDDAVIRDEEFARTQERRWQIAENEQEGQDINDVLEAREKQSEEQDREAEDIEMAELEDRKSRNRLNPMDLGDIVPGTLSNIVPKKDSWANKSRNLQSNKQTHDAGASPVTLRHHHVRHSTDVEAQKSTGNQTGEALFAGINDEIEDLTPQERDKLVQRAFQHEALRARRPVIWIPRDDLGVSDDEIYRTQNFSKHIWISNEYTGLDGKARVVYKKSPPDFSEVDLIEL